MSIAQVARRIVTAGALPVMAGCGSSGEQLTPDIHGVLAGNRYVLRSAAGDPLPTVWIENESVVVEVLADTISLGDRGRGRRMVVQRYREHSASTPTVARELVELSYTRRDDRIEIALACPDLALCVAPPHFVGGVTADGLVFGAALNYATPLRYERVRR